MRKRVLIIGSNGFIGKSFINYTQETKKELYTLSRRKNDKDKHFVCDATNFEKLNKIIQSIKPNEIYNLSGSYLNEFEVSYSTNVVITKNVFDSVVKNGLLDCKILINGSAAEYGFIKDYDNPIDEKYPFNPISVYGLTKIYQTYLCRIYFNRDDLKIYLARPFNVIGYGMSNNLFVGRLIKQIVQHLKKKSKIILGNLNNERDYVDVEDVINAFKIIMKNGTPGEIYNIGSGRSIKIKDLLDKFLEIFNIDRSYVEISDSFIKKFDIPKIYANILKLKNLGWEPRITIEESISRIEKRLLDKGYLKKKNTNKDNI